MNSKILIATTAAALAAGTYYAVAQSTNPGSQGQSTPGMSQSGPSSGSMGQGGAGGRGDSMIQRQGSSTSGQAPSTSQSQSGSSTTPQRSGASSTPQQRSGPGNSMQGTQSQQRSGTQTSPPTAQSQSGSATSGSSANLTTEQRTQIRQTVLKQSNAPRVSKMDFSVSVGTVVPRRVKLVTVPQTIVEIRPAWRGYMYFVAGERIVIVDPASHKIVAVIAA
ncbi:MAG TPA: DUF1236 domain-containing protein [Xanthobacteraceae bacterium]|nr:DUF1236 domain-containing protein [Xanthobacteraceae bacterium]